MSELPVTLDGKMVKLRAVQHEDLEVLLELRNEHFADNIFRQYRPLTMKDQEGYWERVINHENFVVFAVCIPVLEETRGEHVVYTDAGPEHFFVVKKWQVIGEVRVGYINWRNRWAELGIFLGKKYMRKGFGAEALFMLLDYAFMRLGLHCVRAETVTTKVALFFEQFGFKYIGSTEGTTFRDGVYWPDILMELYEETWRANRGEIYERAVKPRIVGAPKLLPAESPQTL